MLETRAGDRAKLTVGRFFFISLLFLLAGSTGYRPGAQGWLIGGYFPRVQIGFAILYWIGNTGLWFTTPVLIYRWLRFRRFSA
jgi:hypothetical protein